MLIAELLDLKHIVISWLDKHHSKHIVNILHDAFILEINACAAVHAVKSLIYTVNKIWIECPIAESKILYFSILIVRTASFGLVYMKSQMKSIYWSILCPSIKRFSMDKICSASFYHVLKVIYCSTEFFTIESWMCFPTSVRTY